MKKIIVFLLILAVLIAIFSITMGINSPKDNDDKTNTEDFEKNQDNEITGGVVKEDPKSSMSGKVVSEGSESSSSSESGRSNSDEVNTGENTNQELPVDLYTKPCGYYFLEYGVCGGVCPDGKCLVDEKSCYCRIVE